MVGTYIEFGSILVELFTWPLIGLVLVGVLIGLVFGSIPGLGGPIAIALLIPATFGMDTTHAVVLFGATLGGTAFGGSISAILINVPGTAPNAATCLDGYPMTKEGRAGEAIGISATSSALGAIFGILVLLLLLPFTRSIILAFGPPNVFWVSILGLTVIASVAKGSLLKGLISGGFGLLIAFIGFSSIHGTYRYGLGTEFLWEGVNIIPVVIGLFAIAEMINLTAKGGSIAEEEIADAKNVLGGVSYVLRHPVLLLRSSLIGVTVGLIPAAGGAVANFLSYMVAKQRSSDPNSFGLGNPEGVIASEASNDAKDGGSILPTFAFGIPGSVTMAVLLGALLMHGVTPGRELMGDNISLLLTLVAALALSNIFSSLIGITLSGRLAKIAQVDATLLTPGILMISVIGAFAIRGTITDVYIAVFFGFIGYLMYIYSYSRIPLLLAFILGPIIEQAHYQAMSISQGSYRIFFSDPISIALILITIVSVVLSMRATSTDRISSEVAE